MPTLLVLYSVLTIPVRVAMRNCTMRDIQNISLQPSYLLVAMVIAVEARELSGGGGGLNLDPLLALSALCIDHRPGLGYNIEACVQSYSRTTVKGMDLGGNSANLHAFSTANYTYICSKLFRDLVILGLVPVSHPLYICSLEQECTVFPKNIGAISNF